MDSLEQLEALEREVASSLQSLGTALQEMSKEKPSPKQVENQTNSFLKSLETVETHVSRHIQYLNQVSTGQPHEGSCYASQKVLQMAWHRLEHSRSRLSELDRLRVRHMYQLEHQEQLRGTTAGRQSLAAQQQGESRSSTQ